jgi:predicted phosphoadenosine phosphosulfate sulfurtransferase
MRHHHSLALFGAIAAACFSTPSRGADDGSRYAAIWEKTSGPAYIARHGLTSQAYQMEFDNWASQGYCLTLVNGYAVGNQACYAAIWEQKSCQAYVARHGMTAAAYQKEFDTLVGQQGFRLKLVSGYNVAGQDFYAAIWEKAPGPVFIARHRMTAQAYQQEFDKWAGQGYCLTLVGGYSVGSQTRYAAIWEKKSCPESVARHGLTSQGYQQ